MDIAQPLPATILAAEFIFGGWVRVTSLGFPKIHNQVCRKNEKIAPLLYPVIPFRDVSRHNTWVGAWMMFTGMLLAWKRTRGKKITLALVLFWTGAGVYSQWRAGMKYWLPVTNALIGLGVWWLENRD